MPTTLYFILPEKIIGGLTSTTDLLYNDHTRLLSRAYIPGIRWLKNKPKKNIDFLIEHTESTSCAFIQRGKKIIIHDLWRGIIPLDFFHLVYSILRNQLLKKNLYSVHAATVQLHRATVLMPGHSGIGKTSLTLELVRNFQALVFSGNKTVVGWKKDSLQALYGTPTITVKNNEREKNKDLLTAEVVYGGRSAFVLEQNNYTTRRPMRITAIVLPQLNDGVKECQKLSEASALHTLYPYFLDWVNADTIMAQGSGVYLGTPPSESQNYLISHLQKTLVDIPVYKISGSLRYITKIIATL